MWICCVCVGGRVGDEAVLGSESRNILLVSIDVDVVVVVIDAIVDAVAAAR